MAINESCVFRGWLALLLVVAVGGVEVDVVCCGDVLLPSPLAGRILGPAAELGGAGVQSARD